MKTTFNWVKFVSVEISGLLTWKFCHFWLIIASPAPECSCNFLCLSRANVADYITLCSCNLLCLCKANVACFSCSFMACSASCRAWVLRNSLISSILFSLPSNICKYAKYDNETYKITNEKCYFVNLFLSWHSHCMLIMCYKPL